MAESSTKKLKTSQIITLGLILCVLNGCGYSGGRTAEELKRDSDKTFEKQKKTTEGKAKLLGEISQIPAQEQLTKTPYRKGSQLPLLEKMESEKDYQLTGGIVEDFSTGEYPAANTLSIAYVDYKKEQVDTYTVPEDKTTVPGYIMVGNLTLVDNSIPAVIYRKTFRGEKAKGLTDNNTVFIPKGSKEVVGKKPTDEIRKFLDALPRK